MNKEVVEVQVRAVVPLEASFAVFIGNDDKTFVIYVDEPVGTAISMFMRGVVKERPLTHDLLASVLLAFGGKVERVVINHLSGSVYHARLIITAANELQARKVVEIDARPSDCIAMAVQAGAPIFVARQVWDAVEDMGDTLRQIEKREAEQTRSSDVAEENDDEDDDDLEDFEDDDEEDDEADDDDESKDR